MTSRRWDRGRRPRGAAPLDIQGTLGTLLRTTLHQMGVVKDAVERQARSSLGQLDEVMLQRRRRDALARLGEVVWELACRGELEGLAQDAEVAALLAEIQELESHLDEDAGHADGTVSAAGLRASATRGAGPARRRPQEPMRVWRPTLDDDEPEHEADDPEAGRDDTRTAAHGASNGPGVARGPERAAGDEERAGTGRAETRGRGRRPRGRDGQAGGGIAFIDDGPGDEDDDLSAYMNDDDVPRRGS